MVHKRPQIRMLRKLLYWMEERQRIYLKRQAGESQPWTHDKILRQYKFCNVYREQDRVTVWIREHWRQRYWRDGNLWFAMCVARLINWPETLAEYGYPSFWVPSRLLKILREQKAHGKKVYTSAYLLGACPAGKTRAEYFAYDVLAPLHDHYPPFIRSKCTLQQAHEWLMGFRGWGQFLAYEVVTDLRHTRYLERAQDIQTWASIGPGAVRGLNRIYKRELNTSVGGQEKYLEELLRVMEWIKCKRDTHILPALEPRDIEHSLCELDKYIRAEERLKLGLPIGLESFRGARLL